MYPQTEAAQAATYSPANLPALDTKIAVSEVALSTASSIAHMHSGPLNLWKRRYSRRSDGATRSPLSLIGLHVHQSVDFTTVTMFSCIIPVPRPKPFSTAIIFEDGLDSDARRGRTRRCGVSSIRFAVIVLSLLWVVRGYWIGRHIACVEMKYVRRWIDDRAAVAVDTRPKSALGGHGDRCRSTGELRISDIYVPPISVRCPNFPDSRLVIGMRCCVFRSRIALVMVTFAGE